SPAGACAPLPRHALVGIRKTTKRCGRAGNAMIRSLFSFTCGAALMLAAVAAPANAADELEARLLSCNVCHGQNGKPVSAIIPTIWGQTTAYLVKQLHDYRTEDRHNAIMSPIA